MTHHNDALPLTKEKKSRHLLRGLLIAQFIGAFNDNAWKLIVFTLATRPLSGSLSAEAFEYGSQMQATLALLVFLIPMMLFSLPAGGLSDRMSKRSLIIAVKVIELLLMIAAAAVLFISPTALLLPYLLLALMGAQSALFSPAKYGIMPQILPYEKLSKGNGLIEMWTMLAIIAGTGLGPILLAIDRGGGKPWLTWLAPALLAALSLVGWLVAFSIPKVAPAREKGVGMIATAHEAIQAIRADRVLFLAFVGTIFYWSITSLLGQNVLVYAKILVKHLERGELFQGIPPATYGVGIAFGALLAGRLSGDRIEYGLIPLGAIGFAITSLFLGIVQPAMPGTIATLILMGMSTGMLVIPLQALIQWRSPKEKKGAIIAIGNLFDVLGMIAGSLLAALMAYMGLDLGKTLVASAFFVVAATIWSVRLLPEALTRLFFIILTTTFYRIRIVGASHIPQEGAALLISNHLSATDAFFVMASVDRPVRFIMSESHYAKWWLRPFAMAMDAIPVPSSINDPEANRKALRQASRYLRRGQVVCIFPEGQVSRTGVMLPFREEVQEIIKGRDCPIVPIHLDRVWGTIFSPIDGRYIPRRPQNIPHPLTVSIGQPLPPTTPVGEVRAAIHTLGHNAWMLRKEDEEPIHMHFIRNVWRCPWRTALIDENQKRVSRLRLMTTAISLARLLRAEWYGKESVAVMLPTSLGAVATNIAASIANTATVNLTLADDESTLRDAKVGTLITTSEQAEALKKRLSHDLKVIGIDTLLASITRRRQCSSALLGLIAPTRLLAKLCWLDRERSVDDPLTITFTNGTTALPKGVILSHFNVSSNVEGLAQVTPTTSHRDKLLHALPLSHPFGLVAMWVGLNHNLPLVLYPYPYDSGAIGELIKKQKATMLWTMPAYIEAYATNAVPGLFATIKFLLCAGEKLPQALSDQFEERFGIRPLEGYAIAECGPMVATSTRDVRVPGIFQAGSIRGSVGQPLPGVLVRVVDPDTFAELPRNSEGLLLVKGPSVMQGYLNNPELTQQALHEGWYTTGDIAVIDDDDFISIQQRLSS